jgi:hypothetical protein
MRLGIGQIDIDPPVDMVREVKVLSNSYAAEYGGSAGSVVIANTKSGTNQYHGTLFRIPAQRPSWTAPGFFNPVTNGERPNPAALQYS